VSPPGEELWVTEEPGPAGAPVVVLVHGSLDRSSSFARVQRLLTDCTVVRFDRRGYGRSLAAGPPESFEQQVDDLEAVLADRYVVLAGHSYGGVICLALAARRPDLVSTVVSYEAPMPWAPWWPTSSAGSDALTAPDPAEAAERFMRRMVGDDRWERLPASTRAQRRAEGEALVAEMRALRGPGGAPYDPLAVTVPVVVGCGAESSARHRRTAEELAGSLPHARLEIVEGASHGVHLTHPSSLARLIRIAAGAPGWIDPQ
jgi:pimeloyl-ACP methyl ester carboxylesterase